MQETIAAPRKPPAVRQILSLALLAVLCIGTLAWRWRGLGTQSLWLDEAVSAYFANLGPAEIWRVTFGTEPNPPLYYLALWAWLQVAGYSEVALRGLSAVAGALAVLPAYALGRALGGERAGLLAALATAANPYLLWYSQEARAFALLALLSATLLYLTHRLSEQHSSSASQLFALTSGQRRGTGGSKDPPVQEVPLQRVASGRILSPTAPALALWAVTATLVLYTHLYGAFTVAASATFLLVTMRARRVPLLLALAGAAAAYMPWLRATLANNDPAQNWRAPATAGELLGRSLAAVAHNGVLVEQVAVAAETAIALLVLLGMAAAGRRGALLLGTAIALPLVASYAISLRQPIFSERYIIAIAIPGYVAASLGIAYLGRRLSGSEVLAALALVALSVQGAQAFRQAEFGKEDFRAAAAFVAQSASAKDVVLFVPEYVRHPFAYYYRGPARLVGFSGEARNPEPFLRELVGEARTLWLLESHWEEVDPEQGVRQWLAQRFPLATEAYPRGIHLRAFTIEYSLAAPPEGARKTNAGFGPLRLAAVEFPAATVARDASLHPPSAWLPVTLYWQAEERPGEDYRPLLQLVDAKGIWGTGLPRNGDLFGRLPTSQWEAGKTMVAASDVVLNPDMLAGTYRLQLAVLDAAGQPVAGQDGSGKPLTGPLALGEVEIRAVESDANAGD